MVPGLSGAGCVPTIGLSGPAHLVLFLLTNNSICSPRPPPLSLRVFLQYFGAEVHEFRLFIDPLTEGPVHPTAVTELAWHADTGQGLGVLSVAGLFPLFSDNGVMSYK